LINKTEINPPEKIGKFLVKLNQASVVIRYPEDLAELQKLYTQSIVKELLFKATTKEGKKEALKEMNDAGAVFTTTEDIIEK
jgi:hypothetical protein